MLQRVLLLTIAWSLGGVAFGEAGQGLTQGDSEASGLFCVGWHRHIMRFNARLQASGGLAIFGNDDGYAIGPEAAVFEALTEFTSDILEHCSLLLQITKTKVYEVSGCRPPEATLTMPLAGVKVEAQWLPGFTCYGVEIGLDAYIRHRLGERGEELIGEVDRVMHLLRDDTQPAWVLLSTALSHQLDYSLTLQYPSDMLEVATSLDTRLWAALEQVSGQSHIPRVEERGGVECVLALPGVPQLEGRSFQHLLVPQPVKLGGCGLRSLVEMRHPAFLGGLEQALPYMVAGEHAYVPLSPHFREAIGSMEGKQHWAEFLAAVSCTSREFQEAWNALTAEARDTWAYMEVEPSGALSAPKEEVGGSSVNGSGAAEGGDEAPAADPGPVQTPEQGGPASHCFPKHLGRQVCW